MATLTFSAGEPTHDWRALVQDILEAGTFPSLNFNGNSLVIQLGAYRLTLNGSNLEAAASRTIESGTISGFTLTNDGTTVLTMTGLANPNFTHFQTMLDGAAGLDPASQGFRDLVAPLFTTEAITATGSGDGEWIYGSSFGDSIDGGGGNDNIRGGGRNDILRGGAGDDVIWGDDSGDGAINGGSDSLYGDAGRDTFKGGGGADSFDGGADDDVIEYDLETTFAGDTAIHGVKVNLSTSTLSDGIYHVAGIGSTAVLAGTGIDTRDNIDNYTSIEDVTGTGYDDAVYGSTGHNELRGGGGNDTLHGGSGGNDLLAGGAGNDNLLIWSGTDELIGGDGEDIIFLYGWNSGGTINLGTTTAQTVTSGVVITVSGVESIIGSLGNDTFTGSAGANSLAGGFTGGADGNDTLNGGAGNDTLVYFAGADILNGGADTDLADFSFLTGALTVYLDVATAQTVPGGSVTLTGIEDVQAGQGNDTLRGNGSANRLTGGAGNDTFLAWAGADTFDGESGSDTLSFAGWASAVTYDLSNATAQTNAGVTTTLVSIENVTGGNGNDTLEGDSGANLLSGGGGDDTFRAWLGADTFNGDSGTDTVTFAGWSSAIDIDLSLSGAQASAGGVTVGSIENVVGGNGNDTLRGNGSANTLTGGSGDDTFEADGSGADVFNGDAGDDTLTFAALSVAIDIDLSVATAQAGAGGVTVGDVENVTGGSGNDTLKGDSGVNRLAGGSGNDTLIAWAGADTFDGGAGSDTLSFAGWASAVTYDLSNATAQTNAGVTTTLISIENVTGGNGNDTLKGSSAANVLSGGSGNDTFWAWEGADTFNGDAGTDTLTFSGWATAIDVDLSLTTAQTVSGGSVRVSSIENLTGGSGNDTLKGNSSANTLLGGSGNDSFEVGSGADVFNGEAGTDTVSFVGIASGITLNLATTTAQSGALGITIGNIENVTGGNGADNLTGSSLANVIAGGSGKDTMIGAAGADTFRFLALTDSTTSTSTCDIITDFDVAGGDLIDLSAIDARTGSGSSNDTFTWLTSAGASFTQPGQLRYRQSGGNTYVEASTDSDSGVELVIRLNGAKTLAAGDFVL